MQIAASPRLKEIEVHAENLSGISKIGLEAMDFMRKKEKPSSHWFAEKLSVLKEARKPANELELCIIPEIESLIKQKMVPESKNY